MFRLSLGELIVSVKHILYYTFSTKHAVFKDNVALFWSDFFIFCLSVAVTFSELLVIYICEFDIVKTQIWQEQITVKKQTEKVY